MKTSIPSTLPSETTETSESVYRQAMSGSERFCLRFAVCCAYAFCVAAVLVAEHAL